MVESVRLGLQIGSVHYTHLYKTKQGSTMEARQTLLLGDTPELQQLIPILNQADWQTFHTTDIITTQHIAAQHPNLHVGIIHLDENTIKDYKENYKNSDFFNFITQSKSMEWIALIPDAIKNNLDFCKHFVGHIYDFHTLPIDAPRLLFTLGHAHGMANMLASAYDTIQQQYANDLIGESSVMKKLFHTITKYAQDDAPILITGESGTGKEFTAKTIHEQSSRAKKPFVVVNCGALPASLIQSELFGYEKGAFTGAQQRQIGKLEAADHGTVFLDEIAELPLESQVNFLRFIQEHSISRLGSSEERPLDVRIIAATNINLENAVDQGHFREDLYYRLNVLRLHLPALRERTEDIPLLAQHYLEKFIEHKSNAPRAFSPAALTGLIQHPWSGNIRELINRIRRSIVMCDNQFITPDDLGLEYTASLGNQIMSLEDAKNQAEQQTIIAALERNHNNISKSADELQVSRVTLYRLLKKYRLTQVTDELNGN